MTITEVRVPDIGDFQEVPVIEVLVGPGDSVKEEDALVTLESDKATMDVPAPNNGVVKELNVGVGDTVSQGSLLLTLQAEDSNGASSALAGRSVRAAPIEQAEPHRAESRSTAVVVVVPDIGEFNDVPVIELLVRPGDQVAVDDPLVTLESDKATMDVPSPHSGRVVAVEVAVGDQVSQGAHLLSLEVDATEAAPAPQPAPAAPEREQRPRLEEASPPAPAPSDTPPDPGAPTGRPSPTAVIGETDRGPRTKSHATPGMRRFARELGVDLARVTGTGRKGRILEEDVKQFVKDELKRPPQTGEAMPAIAPIPPVDFARFGEIETRALSRIKRISGPHLQRAWLNVPHVTHHDDADITELEAFRQSLKAEAAHCGVRVTLLGFVIKALVACLREFPTFNASLSPDGQSLILKKYFNVGVAVDTPSGLVVPVIREVDAKGLLAIAAELGEVSQRARDGKLKPQDLQGGSMSISSLGGIGGAGFTPIVNAPEVAILGLTRSRMTPVWNGEAFEPRLMLPLDLSYDHRVIDGAEGARFVVYLRRLLGDVRRLLL